MLSSLLEKTTLFFVAFWTELASMQCFCIITENESSLPFQNNSCFVWCELPYWISSTGWGKYMPCKQIFAPFFLKSWTTEYIKYYGKWSGIYLLTAFFCINLVYDIPVSLCVEDSSFSKVKLKLKFCFTSILKINLFMRKL